MRALLLTTALIGCCLAPRAYADTATDSLREALDGRSWMAARKDWPCNYRGSVSQQRTLGSGGLTIVSTGRFWQDCNRGLIWATTRPVTEARIYTNSRNDMVLSRRGQGQVLDGLMDRRVGSLLLSVFGGDHDALAADFSLGAMDDSGVELEPRDARVAAHLKAMILGGDDTQARVTLEPADASGDRVEIHLTDFMATDGSRTVCEDWITAPASACDALRSPLRYLESETH